MHYLAARYGWPVRRRTAAITINSPQYFITPVFARADSVGNDPGASAIVNRDKYEGSFGHLAAFAVVVGVAPHFHQNGDRAAADILHLAMKAQLGAHRHGDHEAHAVDGNGCHAATGNARGGAGAGDIHLTDQPATIDIAEAVAVAG